MIELINTITSNPFADIVILLSFFGALGFIIFLWGFSGFILSHGHADHQHHSRLQIVNGLVLFLFVLGVWELLRFVLGLFQ